MIIQRGGDINFLCDIAFFVFAYSVWYVFGLVGCCWISAVILIIFFTFLDRYQRYDFDILFLLHVAGSLEC